MDSLDRLNTLPTLEMIEQFRKCCGASAWCRAMTTARPHLTLAALHDAADRCFDDLTEADWLEAFAAHPKIGDLQSLRMKYAGNKEWSGGEQAGVNHADEAVLHKLAEGNAAYEAKFGFIFIVCATGKSAAEMLAILESRLPNDRATELPIAAGEQRKITHLRLDKLFT